MGEIEGVVQGHRDGHGFVLTDDGSPDVFLPPNEMRAVLHLDRVRVRIVRTDRRNRPEGRVTQIVSRSQVPIIGRLLNESGVYLVAPEDKRYGQDVLIPASGLAEAELGQVVVVELTEPPALYGQPVGRIKEVLGDIDDPGMEIEIAVRKFGVPHVFSPENLAQAEALPDRVRPADTKNRVDLCDVPLVTIDGEDARDFDDAVYCEPAKVGRSQGWRLLVAIADVSHYVLPGSAIDTDAYERATSVYFPRRVIPMLPEKLSNGLCSLNPEVKRLCVVCDMLINANGELHAYQFYPAVMFSHARFTYTEVAAILKNTRGPEAQARGDLVEHLQDLHDVYRALLQARQRRGAIDFETTETQIISDDLGRVLRIEPRVRNDAHRLIEEAMLAANVCTADFLKRAKHPGLYRVHEGPTPEKLEALRQYLKAAGVQHHLTDDPTPQQYEEISTSTRERPDAQQIQTMLLRSMQQAIYTPTNSGHFGLAYEAYTHFTSPIRRYPDLLVHRVIKAVLAGQRYEIAKPSVDPTPSPTTRRAKLASVKKPAPKLKGNALHWEAAGVHCSANERRADEASRDVQLWLKCKYMKEHLGESFDGEVTAVTAFGLFVTLDAMYVEGLVHISELGGDYYRYDEVRQELRGERSGLRYGLGSQVHVQVGRVDLDARRIDFRMVLPGDAARLNEAPARKPAKAHRGEGEREDKSVREGRNASAKKGAQEAAARRHSLKTARKKSRR